MPQWYLVKLELAPTGNFPNGSPACAFLLRLPVKKDGSIDEAARARQPGSAFARRFWQNEADRSGSVVPNSAGWFLAFPDGKDSFRYHVDDLKIRPGETVELTAPDGQKLPFRIVSLRPD